MNRLSEHKAIDNFINANFSNYKDIYTIVRINIQDKIDKRHKSIIGQVGHEWQVDSLLIVNAKKDKFYSTLNTSYKVYKGSNDLIQSLYGVKIDGEWYIHLGENLVAMRDGYKYDKYEPFTWDEISYVAHDQMFSRFISFDNQGNLVTKPEMVDQIVNPEYLGGSGISQEGTIEERFRRLRKHKESQIIDSLEYQQLLDDVKNPAPKIKDPIKRLTWWDKLWGAKEPIFETDEWKEYVKSKNNIK